MSDKKQPDCCEKFKTVIGGQALIEGIMMRGPDKDAVVVRSTEGIKVEVKPRKVRPKGSVLTWPFIRGVVTFFDSQVVGVKALMQSADLSGMEEYEETPSKFDLWLEKKLGNEGFQKFLIGSAVFLGLAMSIGLFFLLPMIVSSFFDRWISNPLLLHLLEGLIRVTLLVGYMIFASKMKEMRRVFAYHGAEHKTIRCYEAELPLTVENVRRQTRKHPRCGTSFLLVVVCISILAGAVIRVDNTFARMGLHLLLLLPIVSVSYELNRWVGRHDNRFTCLLTAPGQWMQNFTTYEPDDSMIEVAIAALEQVLPEQKGDDQW